MYQGTGYWVVKEPVGLQYFRFHDEEFFILNMLDGHVSLQQIKDGFEQRFAPQKITFGDLQQFIGMLHRSGLVISNSPGQGKALRERGRKKKNKENLGKLANVFALRFRGFDPERILNAILPWFGWIFTVPALLFFLGSDDLVITAVGESVRNRVRQAADLPAVLCRRSMVDSGGHDGDRESLARIRTRTQLQEVRR